MSALQATDEGSADSSDVSKFSSTPKKRPRSDDDQHKTKDTPVKHKIACTRGSGGSLDADRAANSQDIGPTVREIPVDKFFHLYLPSLRDGHDPQAIVELLRLNDVLVDPQNVWMTFDTEPSKSGQVEDRVYSTIERIANAVKLVAIVKFDCAASPIFMCNPTRSPIAALRTTSSRPDGYLLILEPTYNKDKKDKKDDKKVTWEDVAIPAEFKKTFSPDDVTKINEQIEWAINQILRNDPTRRFTYAITICDLEVRIWYGDRSNIFVSAPFDLVKDYILVISFFLRVMFASKEDLGWDPTIKRVGDQGHCYDITVRDQTGKETVYRTIDIITIAAAESIRGRATRVWHCNPLDTSGIPDLDTHVALKDVWTDAPRPREGHLYQRINRLAQESGDAEIIDALKDTLLTVVCHGDVYVHGDPDYTRETPSEGDKYQLVHLTEHQKQESSRSFASQMQIKSHTGSIRTEMAQSPEYLKKVHYRIVFQEVGVALHNETSLYKMFSALRNVCLGIQGLHDLNFVHRDLSSSNVLTLGNATKIADLEYVRKTDDVDTTCHNVRTANEYFLPVEVECGRYFFRKQKVVDHQETKANVVGGKTRLRLTRASTRAPPALPTIAEVGPRPQAQKLSEVPFRYNELHDLESVWWMCTYCLVWLCVVQDTSDTSVVYDEARLAKQKKYANDLFGPNSINQRMTTLANPAMFAEDLNSFLHPSVLKAIDPLVDMLTFLTSTYRKAEEDIKDEVGYVKKFVNDENVHYHMGKYVEHLAALFQNADVQVGRMDGP